MSATLATPSYYQRIYCTDEAAWVYRTSPTEVLPTECPNDAEHSVSGAQEVDVIYGTIPLTSANSPFFADSGNVFVADTTGGDVTVNLPSAADSLGQIIFVSKSGSANQLIVVPGGGELVGGAAQQVVTLDGLGVNVKSDGTGWVLVGDTEIVNIANVFDATMAATVSVSAAKEWEFRYTRANAKNNDKAYTGSWRTLPLSETLEDGGSDALLSGNTLTVEPGRYRMKVAQTFYKTERTLVRIYNVTEETTAATSLSLFGPSMVTIDAAIEVKGSAKVFRLEYQIYAAGKDKGSGSDSSDGGGGKVKTVKTGLGVAVGVGETEVYTTWRVIKAR
jgi:hypothetical protein